VATQSELNAFKYLNEQSVNRRNGRLRTFCIMGQQVDFTNCLVVRSHPKPSDLTVSRLMGVSPEDLIHARRKALE